MEDSNDSLSRLNSKLYYQDTRYACSYWQEHKQNFMEMLFQLLTPESLLKFARQSRETILQFNAKSNCVPADYNENVVAAAYQQLEDLILEETRPSFEQDSTSNEEKPAKVILFEGMDAFYRILNKNKDSKGASFASFFSEEAAFKTMHESFCKYILPEKYDVEQCGTYFIPQLYMYFMHIIYYYDEALKGQLVTNYFANADKQREKLMDAASIKQAWSNVQDNDSNEETEPFVIPIKLPDVEVVANATKEQQQKQKQNELYLFTTAEKKAREEFLCVWEHSKNDFIKAWRNPEMDSLQRFGILQRARKLCFSIGTCKTAGLYCPDVIPEDLAKTINDTDSKTNFEDWLQKVVIEKRDKFLKQVSNKLVDIKKHKNKSNIALIALSRWHTLLIFSYFSISLAQNNPLEPILWCVPGYKEGEIQKIISDYESSSASTPDATLKVPTKPTAANGKQEEDETDQTPKSKPKIEEVIDEPTKKKASITCTKPDCNNIQKDKKFLVCGNCKKQKVMTPYCSRECQTKDWARHKQSCT